MRVVAKTVWAMHSQSRGPCVPRAYPDAVVMTTRKETSGLVNARNNAGRLVSTAIDAGTPMEDLIGRRAPKRKWSLPAPADAACGNLQGWLSTLSPAKALL